MKFITLLLLLFFSNFIFAQNSSGYKTTCTPAVPNQDCASALLLTENSGIIYSDNTCATVSNVNNSSCGSSNAIADVWFKVVAPSYVMYVITNMSSPATAVNTAVYEGSCDSLNQIAVNCTAGLGPENGIEFTDLIEGNTYYIQTWSASDVPGVFDIEVFVPIVSVDNLQSVGFTYYPNPVSNSLTMKANKNISSIAIFNMLGQKVKSVNPLALQTSIDMSNLTNGTYFVKVQVDEKVGTFKIIKK